MSLIDKTSIANLIAAFIIIAGVVQVFFNLADPSGMMLILVGAGIGYLFKNNLPKKLHLDRNTDDISTQ